jgi:hypothetical protein
MVSNGRFTSDRRVRRQLQRCCAGALTLCAAVCVLALRCEPAPAPPFEVLVKVTSDRDKPLEGAIVLYEGKKVGLTNVDGAALLRMRGTEGVSLLINVQCPAAFESPPKPINVVLRRVVESKRPEYSVACPPSIRTVVVAVRADNGPNLPIMYLGREVGRTDEAGAASVLLLVKPNEQFQLAFNTTEKGNERLRPQNPVATFLVKQHDELFTLDQRFSLEKKRYVGGGWGPKRL